MSRIKDAFLRHTILIIISVDIIGILISIFFPSYYDIVDYDLGHWMPFLRDHTYLEMYEQISSIVDPEMTSINYPPIYPSFLFLLTRIFKIDYDITFMYEGSWWVYQLIMKLFSIFGFILAQIVFYTSISKKAALTWSLCLPFWHMSFVWGQRDAIFCFIIIMMLWSMTQNKVVSPSIWFALLCLLKPQGAYLLVVLLIYLIAEKFRVRDKLLSLVTGGMIGLAAFLPFMIYQKDLLLPIKLYLGVGISANVAFCCQCGNIYCLLPGVNIPESLSSLVYIQWLVVILAAVLYYAKNKDIVDTCFVYLFSLYMFTVCQHERYILYHFAVLFFMYVVQNKRIKDLFISSVVVYGLHLINVLASINTNYISGYQTRDVIILLLVNGFITCIFNWLIFANFIKYKRRQSDALACDWR